MVQGITKKMIPYFKFLITFKTSLFTSNFLSIETLISIIQEISSQYRNTLSDYDFSCRLHSSLYKKLACKSIPIKGVWNVSGM